MRERQSIFSNIDGILFILWFVLAVSGIVAIYSASNMSSDWSGLFSVSGKHGKQIIFMGVSFVAMIVVWAIDYRIIKNLTPVFYIGALFLLLLTLVIGVEINGSKSWIRYGGVQLQPAEFAKLATGLMLAYFLSNQDSVFKSLRKTIMSVVIIGLPMGFILLQGDFGSMMIFSVLIFVLYREGLSPLPIYFGLGFIAILFSSIYFGFSKVTIFILIIAAVIVAISKQRRKIWKPILAISAFAILSALVVNKSFTTVLKEYQQDRILVLLGMKQDLRGAGYNIWQSKMAIGSGGFSGKGYLQGTQTHGDFVPEVSTDYIFSSIGEEWGFLGSIFVVGLFAFLILRILHLAENQRSTFSRVFMYSAASFFLMHAFINIAMVIGIFPTVGIPLPFFSYGGSSLLSFSLIIAVVLRLNAERSYML